MRLRRLGALAVALLALAALAAPAALGAVATERAEWFVEEGVAKTLEKRTTLDAEIVNHTKTELGQKFTLFTKILAAEVHITMSKVECVGCTAENKVITTNLNAAAFATGRLKFTELVVDKPANCVVAGNQILTAELNIHADWMHEGKGFWNVFAKAGGAKPVLAEIELEGATCPLAEVKFPLTGELWGEMQAPTGKFLEKHEVDFGPAIQTTAGKEQLHAGVEEAKLTGTAAFSFTKEAGVRVPFTVK